MTVALISMVDPNFTLIFDTRLYGPRVEGPLLGLLFIVIGFLLPRLMDSGVLRSPPWMRSWFPTLWLSFAILWTLLVSVSVFGGYLQARNALSAGKTNYVEGSVENFIPMPYTGHALESFTVKGVPFSYSDYVITSGFNNTSSHGGPIHAGVYVQIWYLGNTILRLEVKK